MQAEEWLAAHPRAVEFKTWLRDCVDDNITPLFEWTSPDNQIVLNYSEADLVYLGTRDNHSGLYAMDKRCPFTFVETHGCVTDTLSDYVMTQRKAEDREGDIIRFANGHMVKIKNDWYVRIHKAMDRIRFDRNIVNLILHEDMDDLLPMLPDKEAERVREFEARFSSRLEAVLQKYSHYWDSVVASGLDRKGYAQEWMPTIKGNDPFACAYVFGRFQGKDGRDMILKRIEQGIGSNTKWDDCADWMGL